ncbi:hypothetical protein D3C75_710990 [compost metagenome]
MQKGIILENDQDLDYAINDRQPVEVNLWGNIDYRGKIISYTAESIRMDNGHWYIRGVAEVRTV